MSLISWLLRNWEPTDAARCTSCGKRAGGVLTDTDSTQCEYCGKVWNLSPTSKEATIKSREMRND